MNSIVRSIDIDRGVAPTAFTNAMRNLAGGVSILTVGRGSDITGMTVTSVTSLSIEPPTLLISVNRNASSWPALQRYGAFGVNIVGAHQIAIAERFSGKGGLKGAERFVGATWRTGTTGVPLLEDAAAAIECTVEETIERHSHVIVIGRVTGLRSSEGRTGLTYWNGGYVEVDQDGEMIRLVDKGIPSARASWES